MGPTFRSATRLAAMPRMDSTLHQKPRITCSASRSSVCENSSTLRFDGNSRDFEMRAAHQLGGSHKGARRIVVLEVAAVDGVEFVVKIQVRAINSDRDQIRHRQDASLQSLLDRLQNQAGFGLSLGRYFPGGGVDSEVAAHVEGPVDHDADAEGCRCLR